jgi:hypothetical protein
MNINITFAVKLLLKPGESVLQYQGSVVHAI